MVRRRVHQRLPDISKTKIDSYNSETLSCEYDFISKELCEGYYCLDIPYSLAVKLGMNAMDNGKYCYSYLQDGVFYISQFELAFLNKNFNRIIFKKYNQNPRNPIDEIDDNVSVAIKKNSYGFSVGDELGFSYQREVPDGAERYIYAKL